MPFQIRAELHYEVGERSTALLSLHALSLPNQVLRDEMFQITDGVAWEELPLEVAGENRYIRLDTQHATRLDIVYSVVAEARYRLVSHEDIQALPVWQFRRSALPYLFPSRYCQSDRIGKLAAKEFGGIAHPYDQAVAVCDWINANIDYLSGSTDVTTSAMDTLTQRAGVCRDFAHLGIALCRALSIPARYFTGYACHMQPPDFHACFEACIGNHWFIFDPTRLAALDGLVRIATGRDATDASVATIFGQMTMTDISVSCVSPDFKPLGAADLNGRAISLEP